MTVCTSNLRTVSCLVARCTCKYAGAISNTLVQHSQTQGKLASACASNLTTQHPSKQKTAQKPRTCTTVSNTARGKLLSASASASAASNLPAESSQLMRSSVSRWRPITMSCTQRSKRNNQRWCVMGIIWHRHCGHKICGVASSCLADGSRDLRSCM
jgi:hypothetical protein